MPKGLFLVGWDNHIGPIIEANYPPEITMERDRMLHYLMAIQTLGTSPLIQVQDNKEAVLIYGIPTSDNGTGAGFNYTFIVLILNEDEVEKAGQFKLLFNTEGKKIVSAPRLERMKKFNDFARSLLHPAAHKIVFMGFSNAGKTSTKKFFFEKMQEEQLLNTTIEPTLGFETNYYNLLDLNLALFDTAGQELDRWYDNNEPVLDGSDMIVFFFSVEDWKENAERVKTYFHRLVQLKNKKVDLGKNLIVFCHKFDLIKDDQLDFKNGIKNLLEPGKVPILFTSLVNGGNDDLNAGMQLLLMNLSSLMIDFNNLVNPLLMRFKLDPLFIIDSNNRILARYGKESHLQETKHEQIKMILSNLITKYAQVFQKNLGFSTIWEQESQSFIICVNFSAIHKDLSYLCCITTTMKNVAEFFESYQQLIRSFKWQSI